MPQTASTRPTLFHLSLGLGQVNICHNLLESLCEPKISCDKLKMIVDIFFRPQPQRLGAYRFGMSVRLSVRLSVIDSFPGCIFVTNSRRDLGIGSYERYWPVDVPFDSFSKIWPPKMAEIGQNVRK